MIYGEKNSLHTGVSTFAIRTSQRTDQKLQKSFHLTDPRKNFKIFFPTLQKKIKNTTHSRHSMTRQLNNDNGLQTRWTKTTGYNSTYPKVAVQCSADTFVVNQTLVLRINICGKNRHLRVAANR